MTTSIEILKKIKEMSKRTFDPRPRILLSDIAASLEVSPSVINVLLNDLENRGLVKIYKTTIESVSLTSYGSSHENTL